MAQESRRALTPWIGVSIFLTLSCARADLVTNGSFETPIVAASIGYEHRNGAELPGWTIFSTYLGTVQFNTTYDPVSNGSQAVQIEVPGDWISQTFATVDGAVYRLSFDMSAFTGYGGPGLGGAPCPCASIVDVTAGAANETFSSSSLGYVTQTLDFIAGATTTIRFMNPSTPSAIGNYPHIDNVSVVLTTPVPEPDTYAILLAGLAIVGARNRMLRRVPLKKAA